MFIGAPVRPWLSLSLSLTPACVIRPATRDPPPPPSPPPRPGARPRLASVSVILPAPSALRAPPSAPRRLHPEPASPAATPSVAPAHRESREQLAIWQRNKSIRLAHQSVPCRPLLLNNTVLPARQRARASVRGVTVRSQSEESVRGVSQRSQSEESQPEESQSEAAQNGSGSTPPRQQPGCRGRRRTG